MRICCFALVLGLFGTALAQSHSNAISAADVRGAEALIGLDFSDAKIELLRPGLGKQREHYEVMRQWPLSNGVPPALQFNPLPVGYRLETQRKKFRATPLPRIKLPDNPDALAFYSISELAALLKSRQITSVQLTEFYLERLKRIGP